jgi:hypothetical protein
MKVKATITAIVDVDVLANKDYFDSDEKLASLGRYWIMEDVRSATEDDFLDELIQIEIIK